MADDPVCPRQDTPFVDDDKIYGGSNGTATKIFNRAWWLYFYNLGQAFKKGLGAFFEEVLGSPGTRIPGAVQQTVNQKLSQRLSIQDTGMVPDCINGRAGSMTNGSATLTIATSDSARFTKDQIGKPIAVFGAGDPIYNDVGQRYCAGNVLCSKVIAVASNGLSCTLASPATRDATSVQWACGTDNTPAFNNCIETLRQAGGGILNWDQPGDYFFASFGHTDFNGWHYIDTIDFDNCTVLQGEHTRIVYGYPMFFLAMNEDAFNFITGIDAGAPITTDITQPVATGDDVIFVNPAQMVSGGQPLYHPGDWILIFTGYVFPDFWAGIPVPDSQLVQVAFADLSGFIVLDEPVGKPYIQENYPSPPGWTGPTGPAPFGVRNVTNYVIHNFRWDGLNIYSFFYGFQFYGCGVIGFFLNRVRGDLRAGFYAMNYHRFAVLQDVDVFIDNISSPFQPSDWFWTLTVGSSHCTLRKFNFNSTGMAYLHLHEGATNNFIEDGFLGVRHDCPQMQAHTETGGSITVGTDTLTITSGGFIANDVGLTLQVDGIYTAVVTAFIDADNVTVNPPPVTTFSSATVVVGFNSAAIHIAARSYGLKVNDIRTNGYDISAAIFADESCTGGGIISNVEMVGRAVAEGWPTTGGYPYDVEIRGTGGWRIDCPQVDPNRVYLKSTEIQPFMLDMGTNISGANEGVAGLTSPFGGLGRRGNIIFLSQPEQATAPWLAATGTTVTTNSTDVVDPLGTQTASKMEMGPSTGQMGVFFDVDTPDPGSVFNTGTNTNADRSFVFSFYARSPDDVEMELDISLASFIVSPPGRDPNNTFYRRIGIGPRWKRYDFAVSFDSGASTGTNINGGFGDEVNPIVGFGSIFYVWGCNLQEVSTLYPIITPTDSVAKEYRDGLSINNGSIISGPDIVDDGVSAVQLQGPVRVTDGIDIDTMTINGLDFSQSRNIAAGAHWNGSQWIATETSALIFQILTSGIQVYANTGLSIGSPFTPTFRFQVSNAGAMDVTGTALFEGTVNFFGAGSGTRPVKIDASKNAIFSQIDLSSGNDITGDLAVSHLNGGSGASGSTFWCGDQTWKNPLTAGGGVTVTSSFTTGATTSTSTIQYLDWASAPQSVTVVVSVSTNQETAAFTNGLRTT